MMLVAESSVPFHLLAHAAFMDGLDEVAWEMTRPRYIDVTQPSYPPWHLVLEWRDYMWDVARQLEEDFIRENLRVL